MAHDLHKIASRLAGGSVRTAGKIEFVKDTGPLRRDIRMQGFSWSPDSLRNLAKILWAAQRSQSFAISALRLFSRMPSSEFSPDGLLGGRGYIQNVKEMRSSLSNAVEVLSAFTDTIHDEVNAEHWNRVEGPEVENIVQDAEQVKANPEQYVEQEFADSDASSDVDPSEFNPSSEGMNPVVDSSDPEGEESLPTGGGYGDGFHQMSSGPRRPNYDQAIHRITRRLASLPTGETVLPKVDHIGPAEGSEAGHFNKEDVWPSDDPIGEGFSQFDHLLEDGMRDGVTGDSGTDGDETVFKVSRKLSNYSLLPGVPNDKPMNYYQPGLTDEDLAWMKANNQPDVQSDPDSEKKTADSTDPLWHHVP